MTLPKKKSPVRLLFMSLLVGMMLSSASLHLSAQDKPRIKPLDATPEPGGKIAFATDRDGNYEIYALNPDGGGATRLTSNPANDREPAWSPDGKKLAFVSNRDGNDEIYVMSS